MAHLPKAITFIEKGKITPAINQIYAFICKVEEDMATGELDPIIGDDLFFRAENIIRDLGGDPKSRECD